MDSMQPIKWSEIIELVFKTYGKVNPIEYSNQLYEFIIVKFPETNMGYMTIWNTTTLRAVHLSRIRINEGVEYIQLEEDDVIDIPQNLKFEEPT